MGKTLDHSGLQFLLLPHNPLPQSKTYKGSILQPMIVGCGADVTMSEARQCPAALVINLPKISESTTGPVLPNSAPFHRAY